MRKYLLLVMMMLLPVSLMAGDVGIVAVVNGKAISNVALETRMKLIIQTSNMPNTDEIRRRFYRQVLENLIEEALEQEEASKLNITVSADEMRRAIDDVEERNGMPKGSFETSLSSRGISTQAALDQIRAKLLWQKIMLKKVRSHITISQADINDAKDQITRKQNRKEYQLAEIVLPVLDPSRREEILGLANKIVSEVRKGADFGVLARQFSVSGTALQGGDAGWIPEEKLEPEAKSAIAQTKAGDVTDPIESPIGYKIYKVTKRYAPKDADLDIKQIYLPTQNLPQDTVKDLKEKFQAVAEKPRTCSNFLEAGDELKASLKDNLVDTLAVLDLGKLHLSDLSPDIRDEAASLPVDKVSPVIVKSAGLHLLFICERSAVSSGVPEDDKIKELLMREKIELESRRYLSQLRKNAFIERRL